ncbi:hypothetical protein DUI87_33098 [Hirundo rustica rustica]|uniref:Cdc42 effector-like domain-containing protein n=1 Tax=Hirundo rustica rustica TaxID=333673 RepID=A0A3M0INM4_HIRRU|nr:hypothetical protein DUI87_33098 [Hirundo rustica rustica]
MAAKAPIYLKRGGRRGKKEKLRDVLSSDMISPPWGTSATPSTSAAAARATPSGTSPSSRASSTCCPAAAAAAEDEDEEDEAPFAFSRTATLSGGEPAAAPSPLLKNAISLPALGAGRALTLPAAPPKPPRLRLDEASAASAASPARPRHAKGEAEASASRAGSLLSLHVDLGPSILEDVLQVMERHRAERAAPPGRGSRREGGSGERTRRNGRGAGLGAFSGAGSRLGFVCRGRVRVGRRPPPRWTPSQRFVLG